MNYMKNKKIQKTILKTLSFVIVLGACSNPKLNVKVEGTKQDYNNITDPTDPPANVGIKNYEQVAETVATLTGLDLSNFPPADNCTNPYGITNGDILLQSKIRLDCVRRNENTSMPSSNKLSSFGGSHQVAITKVSAAGCDGLLEVAALREQMFSGLLSGGTVPVAQTFFTPAAKDIVAQRVLDRFWQNGSETNPDISQAKSRLVTLMDALLINATNNQATTLSVLKAVCTTALASAPAMVL